jgi:hypothetical protein
VFPVKDIHAAKNILLRFLVDNDLDLPQAALYKLNTGLGSVTYSSQ